MKDSGANPNDRVIGEIGVDFPMRYRAVFPAWLSPQLAGKFEAGESE
jgi:hypothetical protein